VRPTEVKPYLVYFFLVYQAAGVEDWRRGLIYNQLSATYDGGGEELDRDRRKTEKYNVQIES